jgi:hypothetical protein
MTWLLSNRCRLRGVPAWPSNEFLPLRHVFARPSRQTRACRAAFLICFPGESGGFFPTPQTGPTILPSRRRIRCQAWQSGGIGACDAGRTCTFIARACGKWSPSGDTGETAGHRTDPVVSRPELRAGCACAAHKEAGSGGCVGIVRRDGNSPERHQTLSARKGLKARSCTAKNRNGPSRKPAADIHGSQPLQRGRSRRQKPLNGALRGATYTKPYEAAPSAPSDALTNPRAKFSPRGCRRTHHRWKVDFLHNGFTATLQVPAPMCLRPV